MAEQAVIFEDRSDIRQGNETHEYVSDRLRDTRYVSGQADTYRTDGSRDTVAISIDSIVSDEGTAHWSVIQEVGIEDPLTASLGSE